ncbi:rhodanese-like domain-containing protein [Methylorubrum zatmanii]
MKVVDLDRQTVKQGLAEGSLLLIDVREDHEFARGHIPGSVSHPLSTFDPEAVKALIEADGRRPVFSCASGVRSIHALAAAQQAGLDLHEHYAGAFKDWYAAGEPIEA